MSEKRYVGPGKFVWHELATSDVDRAVEYYGRLFKWSFKDLYRGESGMYRSFGADGVDFGGIVTLEHGSDKQPGWLPYVTVENVDQGVANAEQLNGTVITSASDVAGFGRCAVVRDPTGTPIALHAGGDPREELYQGPPRPGSIIWNDLICRDPQAAGKFYCGVFGWQAFTIDLEDQGTYFLLRRGDVNEAGILLKPDAAVGGSSWLPYVAVEDLDVSCVEAAHYGGAIHVPPSDLHGAGRFAVTGDPTGAVIALFQPHRQQG
jgi:predicted enzyme related to lactoylglutathione lyase